ncbi:acyl-CoA thioesterase [Methylocella sp.]|uniref:acyl-CoA thioesterase n=1 Tax=Methylocella sp. TaxID=1978226 RepID=UPI003782F1BA
MREKDSDAPEDYAFRTIERIRYADQDPQGHVNNVVFATYLEIGRTQALLPDFLLVENGAAFVVARLSIDFLAEMLWPGEVLIATRVGAVGRSSLQLEQALFQNGRRAARAESVLVLTDKETRRSRAISQAGRDWLAARMTPRAAT